MDPRGLVRTGGGLASIVAGVLFLGHLASLSGDTTYGPVLRSSLVLAAHTLLIFVLVALYATHAERAPVLTSRLTGRLTLLGGLAFVIALILFGLAIMRAGVLPRWAGLLLIVGDIVFAAGSFAGSAAPLVDVAGAALTGGAFVWLGARLLRLAKAETVGTLQSRPSPA